MIHYFILGSKCLPDIAHKHTHIPYSIIPLFEAANQLTNSFSQCKTWKETPSSSYMYLILLWKQVFVHKHHTLHIHLVAKYSIFNMYRMKQKYLILWWKLSPINWQGPVLDSEPANLKKEMTIVLLTTFLTSAPP